MARTSSKHPTELEWEILRILWRDGPSPVREVQASLEEFRSLAYTSVMTIMNIMTKKGYLRREKQGASYVYYPLIKWKSTAHDMVEDLVARVFDGSPSALMLHLLETRDLDESELKQLRALIQRKAKEGQS
jgi:BlaI family transcriptional regulator, penicillinase repressor